MKKILVLSLFAILLSSCNSGSTTTTYNHSGVYTYGTTSISVQNCLNPNSNSIVTIAYNTVNPSAYIEAIYSNLPSSVNASYSGNCDINNPSNNPRCTITFSTSSNLESSINFSLRFNGNSGASDTLNWVTVPTCQS